MPTGRKLTDDVSIEELLRMREELDDFIKELQAIQRHTKQLSPMEAW